jgi:hypothetical protein
MLNMLPFIVIEGATVAAYGVRGWASVWNLLDVATYALQVSAVLNSFIGFYALILLAMSRKISFVHIIMRNSMSKCLRNCMHDVPSCPLSPVVLRCKQVLCSLPACLRAACRTCFGDMCGCWRGNAHLPRQPHTASSFFFLAAFQLFIVFMHVSRHTQTEWLSVAVALQSVLMLFRLQVPSMPRMPSRASCMLVPVYCSIVHGCMGKGEGGPSST